MHYFVGFVDVSYSYITYVTQAIRILLRSNLFRNLQAMSSFGEQGSSS